MSFRHKKSHRRVSLSCGEELITKQSPKAECDINNILNQYKKTGIITHISQSTASYSNLPSDLDYQTALNTVIEAENAFAQLPAKVRDRFQNNPKALLGALENPANRAELEALGILKKREALSPSPSPSPAPSPAPGTGA